MFVTYNYTIVVIINNIICKNSEICGILQDNYVIVSFNLMNNTLE